MSDVRPQNALQYRHITFGTNTPVIHDVRLHTVLKHNGIEARP
jgi:hypothetical protein